MNEIKCPNCGKEFTIDEAAYNSIADQVRDIEFAAEVDKQRNTAVALAEAKKDKQIAEGCVIRQTERIFSVSGVVTHADALPAERQ